MVEGNVKTTELIASIYEELNKTPTSNWYKERETAEEETVIIFMSSLEEIVDKYIEEQGTSKGLVKDINRIWLTIHKIYPDCFLDGKINKAYNIQKTLGIRVLHRLFLDCYTKVNTFEEGLEEFEYVLALSNVVESSWLTGKELSNIYFYAGVDGVVKKLKEGRNNITMSISEERFKLSELNKKLVSMEKGLDFGYMSNFMGKINESVLAAKEEVSKRKKELESELEKSAIYTGVDTYYGEKIFVGDCIFQEGRVMWYAGKVEHDVNSNEYFVVEVDEGKHELVSKGYINKLYSEKLLKVED